MVAWIIDDSPTIRAVLAMFLRQWGLRVRAFAHGVGALRYAREAITEPAPALVLVDLELPGMDGEILIRHLRACPRLASARIMLMSGRDATRDRVRGRLAGADAFLVKPVTCQTVCDLVRTTCELTAPPALEKREEPIWTGS